MYLCSHDALCCSTHPATACGSGTHPACVKCPECPECPVVVAESKSFAAERPVVVLPQPESAGIPEPGAKAKPIPDGHIVWDMN